jgi:hypothetical protein
MSYSIHEGLEDARKRLVGLEAIAKKYPDVSLRDLPNGENVWMSSNVVADHVRVVVVGSIKRAYLCPYETVEGVAVFSPDWADIALLLNDLQKNSPDVIKTILATIAKRR